VANRESRQMAFHKLQKQQNGIQVELNNDATHSVTIVSFISFHMPLGHVLELNDVLYVLGLTKNLFSISCMTNLKCMPKFDDQQVIIRKRSLDPG